MYTKNDILAQLQAMNAPRDGVVLMHASLRAIGSVDGGAETLLDALIEYFTEQGGLFCVPTHTWDDLVKEITLDMAGDRNCLGAFSTVALRDARGIRSENPTHSMMVFGDREKAESFIKNDAFVTTPTAPDSCYGKLTHVLLAGVAQNRNTYLHCVDEMLATPNRMDKEPVMTTVRRHDRELVKRPITLYYTDYTDDISYRFPKYDTAFRYHGCITDGYLGNAPTQLCDARKMKDTIELIFRRSGGIDPLQGEEPIPQSWYCTK